jgi:ubiquinol-cytochrome c reductase cytochrome c subunit
MSVVRLLAAAVLAAAWAGCAAAADAGKGKQLFLTTGCYACHGTVGQGAVTGPKIAPDPMALEALVAFLRNTSQAMPPYSDKILSDGDVADIHAYLLAVPKAPDARSIPLLNP